MNNKNLGRGLSAFLDDVEEAGTEVSKIDIEKIRPNPFQPRKTFDKENLSSLATSIKRNGVIQPIIVTKMPDGMYVLVAGERRWRASKMAQLTEIPAITVDLKEDKQFEIAIIENIQRENLNALEEAEAYNRLIEKFGHTQEELAEILGKSRSHVTNMLRLLTLPDDVKEMVKSGKLSFGHARTLIGLENASIIAQKIIENSLNVRETELIVKQEKKSQKVPSYYYQDPELDNVIQHLSELIGLTTNIKTRGRGGIIEIKFNNLSELDELMSRLNDHKEI